MENKEPNPLKTIFPEDMEQKHFILKIRNQLNHYKHLIFQESFGGNAGRSHRGRLQAGLNAFVKRKTGEIVSAGNEIRKEYLENPDLSSVMFTYEVGENNNFENGKFIDVNETNLASSLTVEALNNLKAAVQTTLQN